MGFSVGLTWPLMAFFLPYAISMGARSCTCRFWRLEKGISRTTENILVVETIKMANQYLQAVEFRISPWKVTVTLLVYNALFHKKKRWYVVILSNICLNNTGEWVGKWRGKNHFYLTRLNRREPSKLWGQHMAQEGPWVTWPLNFCK